MNPMELNRALVGVLLAHTAGCSSVSVNADYDTTADFSRLKTWAWFTGPQRPNPEIDGLTDGRIRAAIEAELPGRGLTTAPAEAADVHVTYHAAVRQKIEAYPTAAGYGYGYGRGFGVAGTGVDVVTYDEGTLVVDLIDPKSKNLLWRGTARGVVHRDATPEERETRIRDAVKKILAQFPPAK